jgi:hypothetical protein
MPFGGLAAILMILATLFALAGHFNSDHKTLVACWLYILAGQMSLKSKGNFCGAEFPAKSKSQLGSCLTLR